MKHFLLQYRRLTFQFNFLIQICKNDNFRFAHGPHELRIARFVYPGLHPYDYEVRMNSSNTLSSPYGRVRFSFKKFCEIF